jgi:hypothetical protein
VKLTGLDGHDGQLTMVDADGHATEDPGEAVWGEIWLLDERGVAVRRDYFYGGRAAATDDSPPPHG